MGETRKLSMILMLHPRGKKATHVKMSSPPLEDQFSPLRPDEVLSTCLARVPDVRRVDV